MALQARFVEPDILTGIGRAADNRHARRVGRSPQSRDQNLLSANLHCRLAEADELG